jgi:hypothetical protein
MTPAAWLIARRALLNRPWRSAVLLLGFGAGVAIMIALLSVGDALLAEAQDRNLVAGGDVVVLPEGLDPAVIKVNGVTGLFLTIPHASFVVRDVLDGPRFRPAVAAAAPQITNRLLYVRARGRVVTAVASGGIPSLDRAARAARAASDRDSAADRAWLRPDPVALADRLDRFHAVPGALGANVFTRAAWAEWDYFTVVDPATREYAYLTIITGANAVGAAVARVAAPGGPPVDELVPAALRPGDISTATADQRVGPARVEADGRGYHVTVDAPRLRVDLRIHPDTGFVLPVSEQRAGSSVTGYVVPVARGRADGTIRVPGRTLVFSNAPAFHDHNWGTWRGALWDWGQASGRGGALVYANVRPAGSAGAGRPTLFLWQADPSDEDRGGFAAALPIDSITYDGWRPGPRTGGRVVAAPSEATLHAANGDDAVTVRIRVWSALASPPLGGSAGRGGPTVFLQLRGEAALRGTMGGHRVAWDGPAAAETFVRP